MTRRGEITLGLLLAVGAAIACGGRDGEPQDPAPPPRGKPTAVYYESCAVFHTVNGAGAVLHEGEPGFRRELDQDHDGKACETEE